MAKNDITAYTTWLLKALRMALRRSTVGPMVAAILTSLTVQLDHVPAKNHSATLSATLPLRTTVLDAPGLSGAG